jgi:VCBS repeat-containing protein
MAVRISAGPSSNDDSYTFAGGLGNNVSLNVRGNDGKSSSRPLHSLDDGQSGDLADADPISGAATTLDRSARGAAIWINADGTIGYSTSPIDALVKQLAPGETLQDSFLYATRQTNGSLLWSTVRITITGTNDAPTAANDRADALEDTLATGSVAANDRDVDNGAVLSFAATNAAAGFALAANGTWTLDTSHAVYQDLAAGEVRQIVIGYRVTDQFGASSTASLVVDVIGTNDRPVAVASSAQANEDGSVSGRLTATDADRGATLTYAVVGDAPEGLSLAADGSWTFTANTSAYQGLGAGQVRVLTVAYAATDQAGASGGSTLTITFTGINDAPVALAAAAEVTEDAAVSGLLAGTDADAGARLTFAVESGGAEGFALGADGQWTFDANQVAFQALARRRSRRSP